MFVLQSPLAPLGPEAFSDEDNESIEHFVQKNLEFEDFIRRTGSLAKHDANRTSLEQSLKALETEDGISDETKPLWAEVFKRTAARSYR